MHQLAELPREQRPEAIRQALLQEHLEKRRTGPIPLGGSPRRQHHNQGMKKSSPLSADQQHIARAQKLLQQDNIEALDEALEHLKAARRLRITTAEYAEFAQEPKRTDKATRSLWDIWKRQAEAALKRATRKSQKLLTKE